MEKKSVHTSFKDFYVKGRRKSTVYCGLLRTVKSVMSVTDVSHDIAYCLFEGVLVLMEGITKDETSLL